MCTRPISLHDATYCAFPNVVTRNRFTHPGCLIMTLFSTGVLSSSTSSSSLSSSSSDSSPSVGLDVLVRLDIFITITLFTCVRAACVPATTYAVSGNWSRSSPSGSFTMSKLRQGAPVWAWCSIISASSMFWSSATSIRSSASDMVSTQLFALLFTAQIDALSVGVTGCKRYQIAAILAVELTKFSENPTKPFDDDGVMVSDLIFSDITAPEVTSF
uniref:Uncharacterized protein n=1 Tax=Anopheles culicifacies TaxID=139723 RepID=A0A182MWM5_9DIPT